MLHALQPRLERARAVSIELVTECICQEAVVPRKTLRLEHLHAYICTSFQREDSLAWPQSDDGRVHIRASSRGKKLQRYSLLCRCRQCRVVVIVACCCGGGGGSSGDAGGCRRRRTRRRWRSRELWQRRNDVEEAKRRE